MGKMGKRGLLRASSGIVLFVILLGVCIVIRAGSTRIKTIGPIGSGAEDGE